MISVGNLENQWGKEERKMTSTARAPGRSLRGKESSGRAVFLFCCVFSLVILIFRLRRWEKSNENELVGQSLKKTSS